METQRPAASREEALARLARLCALDTCEIVDVCRTRLVEPPGPAKATLVMWHGFSNCPAQFGTVAEHIAEKGFRVLLPRLPHHGNRDVLTPEMNDLTREELTSHVNDCIDIAAGFGLPVWTAGLSAGAVLASWAAATRSEVSRLAAASPIVGPFGTPYPLTRLILRFPGLLPDRYFWWDPRRRGQLHDSPHAYPGFPVRSLLPVLELAAALYDRQVVPGHRLRRVILVRNPGDFAIHGGAARRFVRRTFAGRADTLGEVHLARSLGWWHDFVDPHARRGGPSPQVAEVFLAALGVASDPTAGGACVPPVPSPDEDCTEGGVFA